MALDGLRRRLGLLPQSTPVSKLTEQIVRLGREKARIRPLEATPHNVAFVLESPAGERDALFLAVARNREAYLGQAQTDRQTILKDGVKLTPQERQALTSVLEAVHANPRHDIDGPTVRAALTLLGLPPV